MCTPCAGYPECEEIVEMLRRFVQESNQHGTHLDVHIELPYISSGDKNMQYMFDVGPVDVITKMESSVSPAVHRATAARRLGMLGHLYHSFKEYMYDEETKSAHNEHVRFHYSDIRLEPNISAMPPFLSTAHDVHVALTSLIFGTYSDTEFDEMPFLTYPHTLSTFKSRTVHKVTKQYLKLMDSARAAAMFPNVTVYLQDRIHEVVDGIGIQMQLSDSQPFSDRKHMFRSVTFLIMDAYLLCRALYYAAEHPDDGTTVVYVGGMHADTLVTYMMHYEFMKPSVCNKFKNKGSDFTRCVTTSPT
jgi:hypothetical protein